MKGLELDWSDPLWGRNFVTSATEAARTVLSPRTGCTLVVSVEPEEINATPKAVAEALRKGQVVIVYFEHIDPRRKEDRSTCTIRPTTKKAFYGY